MQEYCRFRGFQLVGFDPFLQSRRAQLSLLRARQVKSVEASGAADEESEMESASRQGQNVKKSITDDSHEQTENIEFSIEPQKSMSGEGNDSQLNRDILATVSDSSLKSEELDVESEETESQLSKTEKSDSDKPGAKVESKGSGKRYTLTKDGKLSMSKTLNVTPPDDLGCLSFYDCLLVDVLQRLKSPDIRQR